MAPVKDIRITDPVVIRRVMQEQAKEGDKSATKTAARIIERYFAIQEARASQHLQPSAA